VIGNARQQPLLGFEPRPREP